MLLQCVRVVKWNCVKVQCMACCVSGSVMLGELFLTVHCPDSLRKKAIPQSASAGLDAAETSP